MHRPLTQLQFFASLALTILCAPPLVFAAGDPPGAKSVRSLLDLRNSGVVRQHWDISCGAAAIATLLTYQLDHPVSEREVVIGLLRHTNPILVRLRLGFSLLDLKRYAAGLGFDATGYAELSISELAALAPAIAPLRANGFNHFVVVRGMRDGRVVLADPAFGNRTLSMAAFKEAWANGIAFTVRAPGQPHPPNRMGIPPDTMPFPSDATVRAAEDNAQHIAGGF